MAQFQKLWRLLQWKANDCWSSSHFTHFAGRDSTYCDAPLITSNTFCKFKLRRRAHMKSCKTLAHARVSKPRQAKHLSRVALPPPPTWGRTAAALADEGITTYKRCITALLPSPPADLQLTVKSVSSHHQCSVRWCWTWRLRRWRRQRWRSRIINRLSTTEEFCLDPAFRWWSQLNNER